MAFVEYRFYFTKYVVTHTCVWMMAMIHIENKNQAAWIRVQKNSGRETNVPWIRWNDSAIQWSVRCIYSKSQSFDSWARCSGIQWAACLLLSPGPRPSTKASAVRTNEQSDNWIVRWLMRNHVQKWCACIWIPYQRRSRKTVSKKRKTRTEKVKRYTMVLSVGWDFYSHSFKPMNHVDWFSIFDLHAQFTILASKIWNG